MASVEEMLGGAVPPFSRYSDSKMVGVEASQQVYRFPTNNGNSYRPDGTRILRIPVKATSHLSCQESALFFDVKNETGSVIEVQDSAHSFISRLIVRGSADQIIDDIEDYNVLMAMISHHQMGKEHKQSVGAMLSGYSESKYYGSNPMTSLAYANGSAQDNNDQLEVLVFESSNGSTTKIANNQRHRFCIPLQGFLSTSKYLPLHRMGNGLTIEIHLSNYKEACTSQQNTNDIRYEISNVEYIATLISFGQRYEERLTALMTAGITISAHTWHSFRRNVEGGSYQLDVPERSRSLKSAFVVQRANDEINSTDQYVERTASHVWAGNSEYQWKIGGMTVPQAPVSVATADGNVLYGSAEAYFELLKALGHSAHEYRLGNVVPREEYLSDAFFNYQLASSPASLAAYQTSKEDYVALPKQLPRFCMGVDLEAFSRSELISGIDNKDNHLNITFKTSRNLTTVNNAQNDSLTVNIFTLVDQDIVLYNDGVSGFMEVRN